MSMHRNTKRHTSTALPHTSQQLCAVYSARLRSFITSGVTLHLGGDSADMSVEARSSHMMEHRRVHHTGARSCKTWRRILLGGHMQL